MIYADNGATTKLNESVLNAMYEYEKTNYGNPSSLYSFGQTAKETLETAREKIANLLGAEPYEITFVSGGSEADNQALITLSTIGAKQNKKHIITSAFEHHAILNTLKKLEKQGFEVTYLPVNENGIISLEDLKNAINENTCFVSIMAVNNEVGTIEPIEEIGKICREKGVYFHTDAVQAVGHIAVNVKKQNIDMLSLSAHKFHGPKGVGVLYAKKGIILQNLINGGAQERGKRAGTENVSCILGMSIALELAVKNLDFYTEKLTVLRNKIIDGLQKIPYSKLNGDVIKRVPSNINFCFEGIEGESLLLLLDDKGICASSGSACTSGSLEPSHVLLALGLPKEVAHGSLRLTIGEDLTETDADYIVKSVTEVVAYLRSFSPLWKDLESGKKKHVFNK